MAILDVHRQRMNELIELVRRTAANLMNVTFKTTEDADFLEFRHEPYWILSGQMATLNPIEPGAFDGLLPTSVRKARIRKRLIQEIDNLVLRNVENLRWATRKNVEDAFRRFGRALEETLSTSIEATRGIMVAARDHRLNQTDRVQTEVAAVEASKMILAKIQTELHRVVQLQRDMLLARHPYSSAVTHWRRAETEVPAIRSNPETRSDRSTPSSDGIVPR